MAKIDGWYGKAHIWKKVKMFRQREILFQGSLEQDHISQSVIVLEASQFVLALKETYFALCKVCYLVKQRKQSSLSTPRTLRSAETLIHSTVQVIPALNSYTHIHKHVTFEDCDCFCLDWH